MTFLHEAAVAVLLVALTLCLQYAGLAALIAWVRRALATDIHNLGPFHSAGLMINSTVAIIGLHGLHILIFYCGRAAIAGFASGHGTLPLLLGNEFFDGWVRRLGPAIEVAPLGPLESFMGLLMCGVAVNILFAIVTRLVEQDARLSHN
jgi:hypothetical protein